MSDTYLKRLHLRKETEAKIGHIIYCKIETMYRLGASYKDIYEKMSCLAEREINYILDDIVLQDSWKNR